MMLGISPRTHQLIRRVLLFLVTLYFTQMFVRNGWKKFDPEGFWSGAFERWGYPVWFMFFIGGVEFLGGFLILIPRVAMYACLALSTVMLGALVTRSIHGVSYGDAVAIASYMVTLLFLAYEFAPLKSRLTAAPETSDI